MDAQPLLDYFQKLHEWLIAENRKEKRFVGWKTNIDPYSKNSIKVRISLKAAMGDKAYPWNPNEMYLFRANIAYALRQYFSQKNQSFDFTADDVIASEESPRVSFYILVNYPKSNSLQVPKGEVEAAISMNRGRINDAFQLNDQTLEFEGIIPTLAGPVEQPVEVWLVVFGVVMGIVVIAGVFLVVSGIRERKKKAANTGLENPYDEDADGQTNKAFEEIENEQTGF